METFIWFLYHGRKVFEKRHDRFNRSQVSVMNFPPVLMCVINLEGKNEKGRW